MMHLPPGLSVFVNVWVRVLFAVLNPFVPSRLLVVVRAELRYVPFELFLIKPSDFPVGRARLERLFGRTGALSRLSIYAGIGSNIGHQDYLNGRANRSRLPRDTL